MKGSNYFYSEPINAIVKDRPKLASSDYQVLSALDKRDIPYQYEVAAITEHKNKLDDLPDNEQVYVDPGHVEKNIYTWFEKKKFRKIEKSHVRYASDICIG